MCSLQAYRKSVNKLSFHQAAIQAWFSSTLIATSYVQAISDLLGQLVTSPMKLPTLLQEAKNLFQICQNIVIRSMHGLEARQKSLFYVCVQFVHFHGY